MPRYNTESPSYQMNRRFNRRELLAGGAFATAVYLFEKNVLKFALKDKPGSYNSEIHGTTVFEALPGIPVIVDGWTISIPHQFLSKSTLNKPSKKVLITLINRDERNITDVVSEKGMIKIDNNDTSGSGLTAVKWHYYPSEQPLYLRASQTNDESGASRNFQITLRSYHENITAGENPFVFSEKPLPKQVTDELVKTSKDFFPYTGYIPISVPYAKYEDGTYDNIGSNKRAIISSATFFGNIQEFEPEFGKQVQTHELGHALFDKVNTRNSLPSLYWIADFTKAFQALDTVSGLKRSNSFNDQAELSPAWSIFDESTYIILRNQNIPDEYMQLVRKDGHPYDKPTELFASALTVLRYRSQDFITQFQNLPDDEHKNAVKDVVSLIFRLLRSSAREEDLQRLLPQNHLVSDALNIS